LRAAARPRIPRAFEAAGTTSFSIIQAASDAGNPDALIFFLFDLLHFNGEAISVAVPSPAERGAVTDPAEDNRGSALTTRMGHSKRQF
jgi:ATP-dependent DNA ligase